MIADTSLPLLANFDFSVVRESLFQDTIVSGALNTLMISALAQLLGIGMGQQDRKKPPPYTWHSQFVVFQQLVFGGQVQVLFEPLPASIQYVQSGKLRALAVTTATRSEALPDLPTVSEFVPGYEASGWNGVCAPKNTPTEIIEKLNKVINAGLGDPKLKARLADLGATTLAGPPADFQKLIVQETEKCKLDSCDRT